MTRLFYSFLKVKYFILFLFLRSALGSLLFQSHNVIPREMRYHFPSSSDNIIIIIIQSVSNDKIQAARNP